VTTASVATAGNIIISYSISQKTLMTIGNRKNQQENVDNMLSVSM
jgi:hypothetical protein